MLQFYSPSIPRLSHKLASLYDIIKGKRYSRSAIKWTSDLKKAFEASKDCLANFTALTFPAPNAKISLVTDASDDVAGAVLQQEVDNNIQPLGFFSKVFSRIERKYSAFDRELTAIVKALKHFRYFLEGREFTIYTDHKPIIDALLSEADRDNARQARQLAYVSEYTTDIQHLSGTSNIVADALPRNEINPIFQQSSNIDWATLAKAQLADQELLSFIEGNHSLKMKRVSVADNNLTLLCDDSQPETLRPIVPTGFRRTIFNNIHNLSHPGTKATTRTISKRYVWPNMKRDVSFWCRKCVQCQRAKVTRHNYAPLQRYPPPSQKFRQLNVDIAGPLPNSNGYTYILVLVDRFSRWPVAVPMKDSRTQTIINALMHNWISLYEVPETITSDRGSQFLSQEWKDLLKFLGIRHIHTSAYHPQSNGLAERTIQTIKKSLRAMLNDTNWYNYLPLSLLALRSKTKEDLDASSSEIVFGTNLRLPGEFFKSGTISSEDLSSKFLDSQRKFLSQFKYRESRFPSTRRSFVDPNLNKCRHVFIRNDANRLHTRTVFKCYDGPRAKLHQYILLSLSVDTLHVLIMLFCCLC